MHLSMLSWTSFLPVLRVIFFLSKWLLPHITIIETIVCGERGMNLVAMTIINTYKEIGRADDRCSRVLYATDRATLTWTPVRVSQIEDIYIFFFVKDRNLFHLVNTINNIFTSGAQPLVKILSMAFTILNNFRSFTEKKNQIFC